MTKFELRPELLLHPQMPKPLHGLNLRSIVAPSEWDRIRRAAYALHGDCCWACGERKRGIGPTGRRNGDLFGHECFEFDYARGEGRIVEVVAICSDCSDYIHIGRIRMLIQEGVLPETEFDRISEHGSEILKRAGLSKLPLSYIGEIAPWPEWHVFYQGQKYLTLFEDYNAWARKFGHSEKKLNKFGWPLPDWLQDFEWSEEDGDEYAVKKKKAQELIGLWNPEAGPLMKYLKSVDRAAEGIEVSPYFIRDHAISEGLVRKVGNRYQK